MLVLLMMLLVLRAIHCLKLYAHVAGGLMLLNVCMLVINVVYAYLCIDITVLSVCMLVVNVAHAYL